MATRNSPMARPRLALNRTQAGPRGDALVVVFLRGAADALNMVVPHGEEAYYRLRPGLGIPRPDDRRAGQDARTLDLDGFFGLHPAMRPLLEVWQEKHLAFVHACGAPDESHSHFKAMELMERGVSDEIGPATGWIGRCLAAGESGGASPLRAVGLGSRPQRSLVGQVPVTALTSISDFHFGSDLAAAARMRATLDALYAGDAAGQEALRALEILQKIDPAALQAAGSGYPRTDFGQALQQTAVLINAEVGLEAAAIDLGGWDTHFAQSGIQANLLAELSQGLAAFHAEMAGRMDRLTLVVMSEFGRRAAENGSLGTDHGHGGLMMVLGGHVKGGAVHGRWPGLEPEALVGPGDLAVTTDYRAVLGEIILKRLGLPEVEAVFPGYAYAAPGIVF